MFYAFPVSSLDLLGQIPKKVKTVEPFRRLAIKEVTLGSGPAGNATAEPMCNDMPIYGTEDMRPARPIKQACLNGNWQTPQNGLLT